MRDDLTPTQQYRRALLAVMVALVSGVATYILGHFIFEPVGVNAEGESWLRAAAIFAALFVPGLTDITYVYHAQRAREEAS